MHDRNGVLLKIGDKVFLPCTLVEINSTDPTNTFCNVTIETDVEMGRGTESAYKPKFSVNAGQLEIVPIAPDESVSEQLAEALELLKKISADYIEPEPTAEQVAPKKPGLGHVSPTHII